MEKVSLRASAKIEESKREHTHDVGDVIWSLLILLATDDENNKPRITAKYDQGSVTLWTQGLAQNQSH